MDKITFATAIADGAKKAYLKIMDSQQESSPLANTKRYQIINTLPFKNEQDALLYIEHNQPFNLNKKYAGCLIISTEHDNNCKYLFFTSIL